MSNSELKKKNKKIIFVSHNLEPEGATWALFYLVKGFKKRGYLVSVISPNNGPLYDFYKREGIDIDVMNFFSKKEKNNSIEEADLFFVNTILGYKFINRFDISRERLIWCIHESEREVYFKRYPDLKEELFGAVAKVIFVAESTMEIYKDISNNNFLTIHNGIDLGKMDAFVKNNKKDEIRKQMGILDNENVFCIVGAVCLRKGQMEFVQAAIKLLDENKRSNVKFLVVGGRGDLYEKKITEIIKESGYSDQIEIIKESSGAYKYYLASDYFVCNSYIESFPLVVLEAMSFGLPVIATNVYGIPEQIEDGIDGALIAAGDVNALCVKMIWVLQNKEESSRLAKNARKKVEELFSFDVMMEKYERVVQELIAE